MRAAALVIPVLAAAAACGPVSPELAARQCEERARAAQGPETRVGIGVSSDGRVRTGLGIRVSSDALARRDPLLVYEECVRRKTGQPPIRPPVLRR